MKINDLVRVTNYPEPGIAGRYGIVASEPSQGFTDVLIWFSSSPEEDAIKLASIGPYATAPAQVLLLDPSEFEKVNP